MSLFPYSQFSFDNAFRDLEHSVVHLFRRKKSSTDESPSTVVDDEEKFEIDVDVHQFKPEEVKVHLDGQVLTVEGEHKSHHHHSHRKEDSEKKFVRKWSLPESCDLTAVHKKLQKDGHLLIDVPKVDSRRNSLEMQK